MTSIFDLLEHWALVQPQKLLFEFRNRRGEATERHTYQSFHERTQSLASRLTGIPGLAPGDRVLLAYPPGLQSITALLACARAGLIGVPVALPKASDDYAGQRLCAIADDCSAIALFSDGAHLQRLRALTASYATTARLRLFSTAELTTAPERPVRGQDNDVLFLQYTSGSTRRPLGVVVSHSNVIANAKSTLDHTPIGVSWLPQHHDMGLIGYYLFPIVSGGTSYGFAPADFLRRPASWIRMLSDVGATYTSSPNFGYEYCLQQGKIDDAELNGVDLSRLRVLMNASEPARPQTVLAFHRRFARYGLQRAACTIAYGLAENTLNVAHGGRNVVRVDRRALTARRIQLAESDDAEAIEYASCGTPVRGVTVCIRDPDSGRRLEELAVGEICVAGTSVTRGYWNNEEATRALFCSGGDDGSSPERMIHTGDLGFLYTGELYVCGRIKDLIIVGGTNVFPDDLEAAITASGAAVRPRGACAFQTADGRVVLLVEPLRVDDLPDPARLAETVRRSCGLLPDLLHVVPPKTISITTSGKIARADTRERYMSGTMNVLATFRNELPTALPAMDDRINWRMALRRTFSRRGISSEDVTLADSGVNSLALTEIQIELEETLRRFGSDALAEALDAPLLQRLSLRDLYSTLAPLDRGAKEGSPAAVAALKNLRSSIDDAVYAKMLEDVHRPLPAEAHPRSVQASKDRDAILLTGATGFFGPFLLDALLRQTNADIHVLVRATSPEHAMERVEAALENARVLTSAHRRMLDLRVRPVCGDLSLPRWGLTDGEWRDLAHCVGEVFHNGACVNYIMTYEAMRSTNVDGTRTALQFAFDSGSRALHLVSSTFIFGWTARGVLPETECNAEMEALDFGYAQTKWVAEQQAFDARARGLDVRIYRPSLISVSTQGAGDSNDVAIRMLAFMIRHGIAVDTPNQLSIVAADVIARNVVGISRLERGVSPAFHVTADHYYSMTELTRVISRDFGYSFKYYDIPSFIDELNRLCSPTDPVYPLLDFFNRSADKIAAMRLKRYSSVAYQHARGRLRDPAADPSLSQTAGYLVRYLLERGLIEPATARPQYVDAF